jgi:hypothetical protein
MVKKTVVNSAEAGIQTVDVILRGRDGSPLVIHQFSEKA